MVKTLLVLLLLSSTAYAQADPPMSRDSGSVPSPDPTALTTDQLRREIAALKEILIGVIDGKFDVILTRLEANDKAVSLLQEATDKQPERTRAAVSQLEDLATEKFAGVETKFNGVQTQFAERDVRTEQAAATTKVAVDAALQAAEKAVNAALANSSQITAKSEASTTKQIDAIGTLISAGTQATNDKIDDLKARVQAIESRTEGKVTQQQDTSQNWALIIGAIGMLIGVGTAMVAIITRANAPALVHDPGPSRSRST